MPRNPSDREQLRTGAIEALAALRLIDAAANADNVATDMRMAGMAAAQAINLIRAMRQRIYQLEQQFAAAQAEAADLLDTISTMQADIASRTAGHRVIDFPNQESEKDGEDP